MKTITRKQLRETIQAKGIETVLRVPKSGITHKQRKFVEGLVIDKLTGADAYRKAYDTKAKSKTIGDNASRLKADSRIQAEINALEHAQRVAALHSAEALRSLTISTLTSALIDPDVKIETKIQAAKILGQVTEVAAFTDRKEITHIKDSGAIREQILDQLKTMMLSTADAETVDATDLLKELVAEPHRTPTPQNAEWDSGSDVHTIPHEQSPDILEPTPLSAETPTPGVDIFLENDDLSK